MPTTEFLMREASDVYSAVISNIKRLLHFSGTEGS